MYEALLVAKVPKDQATAAAAEVAKGQDLASKSDLLEFGAQLRTEMDKRFGELRTEMDQRLGAMDQRLGAMEKRLGAMEKRLGGMDKRLGGMDKRFGDIEKSLALLKFAVFSGGPIILALLIKLVFIP